MTAISKIALVSAIAAFGLGLAHADDTAKLKELERAMTAPASHDGAVGKKVRSRAIVFDSADSGSTGQAGGKMDCGSLGGDVRADPIDFTIQFKVGSSEVAASSEGLLLQISKLLALSPDRCVLVEGHTDASGNADKNQVLSRDRATSVVKFIAEKGGIDRVRLVPVGKGSSDPMKNLDARDPKNRRVVFKVVAG